MTREEVVALLGALERGEVRAAAPDADGNWVANAAVKEGILAAFRLGVEEPSEAGPLLFRDRDTLPPRRPLPEGVRVVPGGTALRRGAFLAKGVVVMPPAYVNVGAYVDEGSMIDSHALVGSCAQIGKKVHLSAAAQVGGVLEPVGAVPVVIEDEVFVGGGAGHLRRRPRPEARRPRGGRHPDGLERRLRSRERARAALDSGPPARHPRGRRRRPGLAAGHRRLGRSPRAFALGSRDREVSRCEDGREDGARERVAVRQDKRRLARGLGRACLEGLKAIRLVRAARVSGRRCICTTST